jgi:hypothetical protein
MCDKSNQFKTVIYRYVFGQRDVLVLIGEVVIGKDLILDLRSKLQYQKDGSGSEIEKNIYKNKKVVDTSCNYLELAKTYLKLVQKIY